ncbi:Retrotransposon gag protein [Arachis hypogaea]|nr:Retrotransposon gag protein [Arachis hypogaea]
MLGLKFNLQFDLKLENEYATQGGVPRLTSSLTSNWRLNARTRKSTRGHSTFKLQFDSNWSLNVFDSFSTPGVALSTSTFNLQFDPKLEVKRVRHLQGHHSKLPRLTSSLTSNWRLNVFDLQYASTLSTFNLQFDLKLEGYLLPFPRLSFSLTLTKLKRASTNGLTGSVWRLSCSLSLNYNLNATLEKGLGSTTSSRLWIINPRQKKARRGLKAQEAQLKLNIESLSWERDYSYWNPSEPWERNGGFMLEKLSHSGLDWGLDGYCDMRGETSTPPYTEPERTLHRLRREARGKRVVGEEESEGESEDNFEEALDLNMDREVHNHERADGNNAIPERRVLSSYINPTSGNCGSSIQKPPIQANNFELKPQLISLVENHCSFGGSANEDPNQHLTKFLRICDTVKSNGVQEDAYKLLLFPFSLRDKAAKWLESFPRGSLTTWDEVEGKFLARFYPPQKVNRLRSEVQTFRQQDGETLYEAWERFKDLTRKCPPNMFHDWVQLHIFYDGLSYESRKAVDHSSGGSLNKKKTVEEAIEVIETVAENEYYYASERHNTKGVMELNHVDTILAQNKVFAKQLAELTRQLETKQVAAIHTQDQKEEGIEGGDWEEANYVGNQQRQSYDPHSNTYNPGWRNHPNFGWGNQQTQPQNHKPYNHNQQNNSSYQNSNQRSYQATQNTYPQSSYHGQNNQHTQPNPNQQFQDQLNRMEGMLATMSQDIIELKAFKEEVNSNLQNQGAAIQKLENQILYLTKQAPGTSSSHAAKAIAREECKAITLRSGKNLKEISRETTEDEAKENVKDKEQGQSVTPFATKEKEKEVLKPYTPKAPYPQRLMKSEKDGQFSRFLEIFKKLQINIPFAEAIEQMPLYAKFLKELMTKKRSWRNEETVLLTEECSASFSTNCLRN